MSDAVEGSALIPGLPDPSEVPALFARHPELRPEIRAYTQNFAPEFPPTPEYPCGCCVLVALLADRIGVEKALNIVREAKSKLGNVCRVLGQHIGIGEWMAMGIIKGWDDDRSEASLSDDEEIGCRWGAAAIVAVKATQEMK